MKVALSIAVLALIGAADAKHHHHQSQKHNSQKRHNKHHSVVQQQLSQQNKKTLAESTLEHQPWKTVPGSYYMPTDSKGTWFDLDDHTERIHGTEKMDDLSPHDPDVVDAPEDMPRVGNDHQKLHNAKLSPDGYYNGWFHKDFQGNYVQGKSQSVRGRPAMHSINADSFVMYDHENDTEDIPDGIDPIMVQKHLEENAVQNHFIYPDEESEVQLKSRIIPHENDTDDVTVEIGDNFDRHHSKAWNMQVNERALQIEHEMQIQENTEKAQIRAKEEAVRKAAIKKQELEAEKKKKEELAKWEKEHKDSRKSVVENPYQTIDLSELYKDIAAIQTRDDIKPYEHHSAFWESSVDEAARDLEKTMQKEDAEEQETNAGNSLTQSIQAKGMTATPTSIYKNPSFDYADVWANLVQLGDHENDAEDIDADFDEEEKKPQLHKEKAPVRYDFAGNTFDEAYDE